MTLKLNLALQGGGAHGAFTWGVLDRLLQEPDIEITGISGTSAGALNGAALKAGLATGGAEGARENLEWLWKRIGAIDDSNLPAWFGLTQTRAISAALGNSPMFAMTDAWNNMFSPYSMPVISNPLRALVEELDFKRICASVGPAFYVGATNVRSGKARVFAGNEISADAILASACLPTLYRAVEIEDPNTGRTEAYWDGGYTGNPPLFPLYDAELPDDILVININPLERDAIPRTPQEIRNRINEISFNTSLLRELRAIDFVSRLIDEGTLTEGRMKRLRVHMIADDALMNDLSVATKMMPIPAVLSRLKIAGQDAAGAFLAKHKADIGKRSSVDLRAMFS
ncbi:patatin-like phospholipase family protein [Lentibacter algarum]|uniref:patatin-like phospholipase family protein n=1 Tax=Lentibacter algarum TaxID=576131 RepID=UPI001C06B18B|nr:patatin-like phospholipase family protein [Lentibacter algarum]MBU2982368.1 patatin-like phospholipase family protein [Lentibacter algarum]